MSTENPLNAYRSDAAAAASSRSAGAATSSAPSATSARTSSGDAPAAGLVLRGVNLVLGDGDQQVTVLDQVDLEVAPGEFVAIVGPSGSGKSSLLAVAGALSTPDSGVVQVAGTDLTQVKAKRTAKLRLKDIGFVFQSGNLIPSLKAVDQLRLMHRLGGKGGTFDPMPLLEAVGMGHRADRRPGQLSGGERQRVGIARALVNSPSVLLVDEPTSALDRQRSQDIVRLLKAQARDNGVATVMVTHDPSVLEHCDRVYEMQDGRLTPA